MSEPETPDRADAPSGDDTLPLPGYVDIEDAPVPETIGPYPVAGVLGHGGMGVVYAARDPRLKRRVAIKVLPERLASDESLIARFRSEAQLLASLNHPNIATIYTLEETPDFHYLTMELVPGRTLSERLEEGKPPLSETLAIARQIARGLEAAHAESIVHRDLKPPNIMLTPEGRVKLLDFGLARAVVGDDAGHQPISGTPGYMSPEQARGERAGPRADTWALGCVLYECLTGHRLVAGETPSERIANTLDLEIDWSRLPDETPEHLRALLERTLSTGDDRLEDVSVLRRELEEEVARRRLSAHACRTPGPSTTSRSLPVQLSSFVGRAREIEEISTLLAHHRLVTLTGFGGAGKTRLSVEVAARAEHRFPDGIYFVDLSAITDGDRVPDAIARSVGLKEQTARTLEEVLTEFVRERRALVVLDNCEHLVAACAEVTRRLLDAGRELVMLATSREPLRVKGESVYRVPSMPVPSEADESSVAALEHVDAVRLFVDRARAADASFALSAANASFIARICRRLEGSPLGLELAAAKVRAVSPEEIAERLESSFAVLAGGGTGGAPRHETLGALIDWSHDLLSPAERVVLRRLAVFAGGWTLDAAEAVCAGDPVSTWEVIDLNTRLVDRSLVTMTIDEAAAPGRTRYRMLEMVREYALERLREADEEAATRVRHRDFYVALAEAAEPHMRGFEQARWFLRMALEHENMRVAFESCAAPGTEPHLGVRLAGALGRYWMIQGHWSEGRAQCDRVLRRAGEDAEPSIPLARTLNGAGNLAFHQGDFEEAQRFHRRALALRRVLGDESGQSNSLNNLGETARMRGNFTRASVLYGAALAIQERIGDRWGEAVSHNNLGEVAQCSASYERAREHHERALAMWPELGDRWGVAWSLSNLGYVALKQGDLEASRAFYERSLDASTVIGDQFGVALSLHGLGEVAAAGGDRELAARQLGEALTIRRGLGDRKGTAESLEAFATLAMERGDAALAARLLGAAAALRERLRAPAPCDRQNELTRAEARLREALGARAFAGEWDRGRTMFVEEAVELALGSGAA